MTDKGLSVTGNPTSPRLKITGPSKTSPIHKSLSPRQLSREKRITEHKRAEEALSESEEKYRTLVEQSLQGIAIAQDSPPRLVFVNRALGKTLGYTPAELMALSPEGTEALVHPEDRMTFFKLFRDRLAGRPLPSRYEFRGICKDGSARWLEVSTSRLLYKREPAVQAVFVDITERKQAEETLQESEERYRSILDNIEDGYFEVDLAGNFTFFNESVCRIMGYAKEELFGMNDRQYTDPQNAKKLYQTFNQVYRTGEPVKGFDWVITRKDGAKRFVEASVSPMKDSKGQPCGFRGIVRDITERKKSEQEMAALQEQFRQSQKMEAIGRLAGGIAHDFNNLLTVIRGYSQLSLMDLRENEKLRGHIEEIQRASQKASDLTHHLLAFSRRQIMEMKILDLNTLLKDLDRMLHRVIGEDIELTYRLANDLGKVKIDLGQIEQVILNLAVNARDAMPSGGKLTIETSNAELDETYARTHIGSKPGHYVMLSVSDTGVGMIPEVRERAFEPFFTTKEKGKGTGLGLSTVYGIVKQSGGNIWAYSEPGRGTTFKIYLPQADEFLMEAAEKAEAAEILKGSETILVVEDEEEVLKLVAQILTGQGYTVIEASDGDEAMDFASQYERKPIHLLLTDVVMPGMSGGELAQTLKVQHPGLKVLYMSGYTDNAIVHHGVLEEGINYIQKPFTLDALARKVREVLDR